MLQRIVSAASRVARDFLSAPIVDCDADPWVPNGCEVREHRRGGRIVLSPENFGLFVAPDQGRHQGMAGNDLRQELRDQPVLNANVLGAFMSGRRRLSRIPKTWKNIVEVCFWGTVYFDPERRCEFVYSLYWHEWDDDFNQCAGEGWFTRSLEVGQWNRFSHLCPAAVLKRP